MYFTNFTLLMFQCSSMHKEERGFIRASRVVSVISATDGSSQVSRHDIIKISKSQLTRLVAGLCPSF